MRWSSVVRQCRLDCVRVDLFGLSNVLFMLLLPVLSCVAALVLTVTGAPGQVAVSVSGGVSGMAAVMSWMSALRVNVAEESSGHRAMNGMIPIARTSQVAGRFLFLLVTCAMWTVDVMACSVFLAFDSGWAGAMILSAVIFAFSLIVGSILMAFSYRFTFRAMMRIFVVVMVGLYALVALLSRLPFDWQGLLQGVADFMSVWWRAALIAVVLCVGVYCISAALAIRFYRAKEL
ncbi:ABC-2 transporter permease [uncultured Bifidobacterium sp.]|uniref:ABC-2 transporter permease n=1 Tax=uncultured Bifidobacterium sp. TaxID=165187 RepID=UPI00258F4D1E|nr:ABC-2 transporter permease [uncultured Bifidobacterium sp.]